MYNVYGGCPNCRQLSASWYPSLPPHCRKIPASVLGEGGRQSTLPPSHNHNPVGVKYYKGQSVSYRIISHVRYPGQVTQLSRKEL